MHRNMHLNIHRNIPCILITALGLFATPVQAEIPDVITDIAPVHSLVSQVMGDLGTPQLLLTPDHDPHHFQMRPSQRRALSNADLVIWMGDAMTPWLGKTVESLDAAQSLELLHLDLLPLRIENDVAEHHDSTDTADHSHAHDHASGLDPHAWLDPVNAAHFLHEIAETLAAADPDNAETYLTNASAAQVSLTAHTVQIADALKPIQNVALIPYHNAYRYFFIRFDLHIAGSISSIDGVAPSAALLRDLKHTVATSNAICLFTEPGANAKLIKTIAPNAPAILPKLDALNAHQPLGPDYYRALLQNMTDTIRTCQNP